MTNEDKKNIIDDLREVRNYFGEHDKTTQEHKLYGLTNKAICYIKDWLEQIPAKITAQGEKTGEVMAEVREKALDFVEELSRQSQESRKSLHFSEDNLVQWLCDFAADLHSTPPQERFKMPDDKTIVGLALLFNNGKIEHEKLQDMVAMSEFIIDRLYENGDATIPSSKENNDNEN